MGNNKGTKKCRRCGGVAVQGKRHCEHCLTHRQCSCCKQELHVSEFNRTIENSAGNLGRCKKCEDLTNNYKKCFGCKQLRHKHEFAEKSSLCFECKKKSNLKFKEKYGHRKCTICKQIKSIDEFDYLLKTCKVCANGRKPVVYRKHISEIHCRYCNKITDNESRVCSECVDMKRCIVCHVRKNKNLFENDKKICAQCLESRRIEKISKKNRLVKQKCCKCDNIEEVNCRYEKIKKHHVCSKCLEEKKKKLNNLPGDYVYCNFCKKPFMFLSSAHILKCSNYTCSLKEYKQKYGENSIYSEKYRLQQKIKSKEVLNKEYVKEKLSIANKKYCATHREQVLIRTEKMRNSPKRIEGIKRNFANMPFEQHQRRSIASKESWKKNEVRNKRLKSIRESDKAKTARKNNIQICLRKAQPFISKPARQLFEFLKEQKLDVHLEFLFGFYHLDIAMPDIKLCIEVDGDWWHGNSKFYLVLNASQKKRQENDRRKETYLRNKGWTILRYWQSELLQGFEKVLEDVNSYKTRFLCCQQNQKVA